MVNYEDDLQNSTDICQSSPCMETLAAPSRDTGRCVGRRSPPNPRRRRRHCCRRRQRQRRGRTWTVSILQFTLTLNLKLSVYFVSEVFLLSGQWIFVGFGFSITHYSINRYGINGQYYWSLHARDNWIITSSCPCSTQPAQSAHPARTPWPIRPWLRAGSPGRTSRDTASRR